MSELLRDRGHSFRDLAQISSINAGYLNRLANGARRAPAEDLARAIDAALRADGELVSLARREHAPPTVVSPHPMGDADAAHVRATVQHLVGLDTLQGSAGLFDVAHRSFRSAADRLATVGGTPDARAAVADLGTIASWIAADNIRRDEARILALEALALADLAGDSHLHRFLISHLSMVSEHGGRYADALAWADRLAAEDHGNPRVAAMAQIRRAGALSGLGVDTEAVDAWQKASDLLTASTAGGLTWWIHDAEMAIHRAVIATRTGDRSAVDWAHRGVEWLPGGQGRDQVLFRARLLRNAVTAHAWSEVPAIAEDLVHRAGMAGSARVPEMLGQAWRLIQDQRVPAGARDAIRAAYEAFR